MNLSSTLRTHLGRISLGGRITIVLALVWSVSTAMVVSRVPDVPAEPVTRLMTLPMGLILDSFNVFGRRGVMLQEEVNTACAMMIPNLFILGYTAAGICKLVKWLVMCPFTHAGSMVLILPLLLCQSGVRRPRVEVKSMLPQGNIFR